VLVEDTNWSAEAKDPFGYPYSIAMRPDQLYEHFYSLTGGGHRVPSGEDLNQRILRDPRRKDSMSSSKKFVESVQ
jgi:hypothetical protein